VEYENAEISKSEAKILQDLSEQVEFESMFQFLRSHNGWRKRAIHIVLGSTSGGKSTLVRSLLIDALEGREEKTSVSPPDPKRVGIWLSEESRMDFLTEFARTGYTRRTENLFIFSEQDYPKFESVKDLLMKIEDFIQTQELDILFFDNITTSKCYLDLKVKQQSDVSVFFKGLAQRRDIPLVIVAHTGAKVTENYEGIIEGNDIRGSKTLLNIANFFYILQSVYCGQMRHNTLRIVKHRGQDVEAKLYSMGYFKRGRIFASDNPMSFKEFKEIYKERNRL